VTLWKACFDFVHIIGTVTNYDVIPYQNLILSITTILGMDKEGLPVFRFGFYLKRKIMYLALITNYIPLDSYVCCICINVDDLNYNFFQYTRLLINKH